jgi:pimeloyl-ACP methyl ester carboxylesterase
MGTLAQDLDELADEFAVVGQAAEEAGWAGAPLRVRRGWVSVPAGGPVSAVPAGRVSAVPAGGQVSAVIWGAGAPELVFLHDRRESARVWDGVVLAAGRGAVAIDLPGHGWSGGRRDGRYEAARIAPAVAEAIRSFAPRARLVVGTGLGGLTALAVSRRYPWLVPGIALVSTLPGALADRSRAGRGPDPACDELAQLPVPVTLVRGGGDGPLPEAELAQLRRRAPQLGLVTVAGAGADIAATHPRELAAVLEGLVSEAPARRPGGRG